jgi:hypothetical protein
MKKAYTKFVALLCVLVCLLTVLAACSPTAAVERKLAQLETATSYKMVLAQPYNSGDMVFCIDGESVYMKVVVPATMTVEVYTMKDAEGTTWLYGKYSFDDPLIAPEDNNKWVKMRIPVAELESALGELSAMFQGDDGLLATLEEAEQKLAENSREEDGKVVLGEGMMDGLDRIEMWVKNDELYMAVTTMGAVTTISISDIGNTEIVLPPEAAAAEIEEYSPIF